MNEYEEIINKIKDEIVNLFKKVIKDVIGNSNVGNNINCKDYDLTFYNIIYFDYLDYINSGRRKHAKKVPIAAIIKWMKEKHISSDNRVAYALQQSIFQKGIAPRNIWENIDNELDKRFVDEWGDEIADIMLKKINNFFEK